MNIEFNWPVWPKYREEHESAVRRVIRSNQLFAAHEVAAFESEFSSFVGAAHAIGVGNATQGLVISAPYPRGKALHFRFETALSLNARLAS